MSGNTTGNLRTLTAFLFCLFLLVGESIYAAPVREMDARKVAAGFVRGRNPLRQNKELTLVFTGSEQAASSLRSASSAPLYVYNIGNGEGFVIIAGDDSAHPVLGFADRGNFGVEHMPVNLEKWIRFYEKEIAYVRENLIDDKETKKEWDELLRGDLPVIKGKVLPTANWDQAEPYNVLCPDDSLGKKSVTGCVATAMSIVMKYHRWPENGTGSHEYKYKYGNDSIYRSESFDVTYEWDKMPDTYSIVENVPQWSAEEALAVSTLMYHCGIASEMQYDSKSSGAYTYNVIRALIENFGYDNSTYLAYRNLYPTEIWNQMIRTEIDENRPVLYSGATIDNSGHLFVIDGYAYSEDYFHVNWGWSGYSNGYYRLSSLQPNWQGIGGSETGAGYSYEQEAVIGMQKAIEGSEPVHEFYYFVPNDDGRWGLYTDKEYIVENEPFKLYFTGIYDRSARDFDGAFAFFLIDGEGNLKEMVDGFRMELERNYYVEDSDGVDCIITKPVEEGDHIRMYYSRDLNFWYSVKGEYGVTTRLNVYKEPPVANNDVSFSDDIRVNSTHDQTEITVTSLSGALIENVKIIDLSGRVVQDIRFSGSQSSVTLSMTSQQTGIFILHVKTSSGEKRVKMIKR